MLRDHMCLHNLCKIWPKQKFCFRGMGTFLFYFCWFYPGINDTCENERQRAEEASVGICCPPLASQTPKNTDGLYDCYGLETHSMRSNLSSYREGKKKKKKKYMNVGLLPTRDSLNQQWERASYQRVCWSKFPLPGQDLLSLLAIRGRKK